MYILVNEMKGDINYFENWELLEDAIDSHTIFADSTFDEFLAHYYEGAIKLYEGQEVDFDLGFTIKRGADSNQKRKAVATSTKHSTKHSTRDKFGRFTRKRK